MDLLDLRRQRCDSFEFLCVLCARRGFGFSVQVFRFRCCGFVLSLDDLDAEDVAAVRALHALPSGMDNLALDFA